MQKIPKTLHFIWAGDKKIPNDCRQYVDRWKLMYSDYEVIIWDDSTIDQYGIIPDHLLGEYHNKDFPSAYKADLARYNIIYRYGGIYLDVDFECLRRMPDSFLEFDFLGSIQNNREVGTAFFAAKPNCELMREAIDIIPHNLQRLRDQGCYGSHYLYLMTGPEFFTSLAKLYYASDNYWFFTPEYFYPYSWREPSRRHENFKETCPLAYAVHHWFHTWGENYSAI